ncbi:hypothetical protein WR25_20547 [Diploscapter pachys]|uniref:Uncharacterized protein n=1 Tax=Diploscapter pachys TaxID=2018661 RepID=A0A2A2KMC9_9BILA|nr:hypothetical protein WR25_20547 [Diploscapter pachys]
MPEQLAEPGNHLRRNPLDRLRRHVASRHARAARRDDAIDRGIVDPPLQLRDDALDVVAQDDAIGEAMPRALQPRDERIARPILGEAPRVGDGEHGDIDRAKRQIGVDRHQPTARNCEATRSSATLLIPGIAWIASTSSRSSRKSRPSRTTASPSPAGMRARTSPRAPRASPSKVANAANASAVATRASIVKRAIDASPSNGWMRLTDTRGVSSPGRRSSSTVIRPHPPQRAASSSSAATPSSKQVATNWPLASDSVAIM